MSEDEERPRWEDGPVPQGSAYDGCISAARLYTSGRADLHTLSPEVWAYLVRGLLREPDDLPPRNP